MTQPGFDLTTNARPYAVWPRTAGGYWTAARDNGQLPVYTLVGETQTQTLHFPPDTLFVADHPDGLLLVLPDAVAHGPVTAEGFKERGRRPLPRPLQRRHPPIWLNVLTAQDRRFLVVPDGDALFLVPEGVGQHIRTATLPEPLAQPYLALQPAVDADHLIWNAHEAGWTVAIENPDTARRLDPPPTRNMEQAALLSMRAGRPLWLTFGGTRGDLSGFGWRLHGSPTPVEGEGIVTRYGTALGPHPSVFVLTVPASVRAQAWQALRGYTAYTCTQWLHTPAGPRRTTLSLRMHKPDDRDRPYALSWDSDLNADGYADLLLADDADGLRVHLSGKDGLVADKPTRLGANPDLLLWTADHLLTGKHTGTGWRFQVRRAP